MVNRLSAYIIHNGGQTTIDSRKKSDFLPQVVIPYTHKIFMRSF